MTRRGWERFGTLVGAVAVAGWLMVGGITPRAAGSGRVQACAASQLRITLRRALSAGPAIGGYIGFQNVGPAACELRGWPRVVAETPSGDHVASRDVRTTITYGPSVKGVPVVRIAVGSHADAAFITSFDAPGGKPCNRVFDALDVGAPDTSRMTLLPIRIKGYHLYACMKLEVSMVVAARDLYKG